MAISGNSGGPEKWSSRTFVWQILRGRWFMLFASTLITSAASPMFGSYSAEIMSSLGYNQTTLNLLSFFKDVGVNAGIFAGVINEFAPPWLGLSIGAVLNFSGYFLIWLSVSKKISAPRVWHMCVYIFIASNSQPFINTAAVVTCVKNFGGRTAVVSGLLTGFAGLSGAIITQLYHALACGNDSKSLIFLLIAGLPAAVSLAFSPTIRIIKVVRDGNEVKVLYRFLYVSLGLAIFLMVFTLLQNKLGFARTDQFVITATVVVVMLLLLPVAVVLKEELNLLRMPQKQDLDRINVVALENLKLQEFSRENISLAPERGQDHTILQALVSIDMLLLFLATICGVGGTITTIDNLGEIGTSFGYPTKSITTYVSLVSTWNYLGRVISGFLSEHFLIKYEFPRPLMLTIIIVISSIAPLLIAFNVPNGLYVASVIIGFCFGAQWPLLFAIISELFGLKNYAVLYNFVTLASPIGSYLLKVRVTGYLYDTEAKKQLQASARAGERVNSCDGVECFRLAFIIIAVVTVFGAVVSLLLAVRTVKFYKEDVCKKLRREEATALGTVEAGETAAAGPK
ncbi:hypothetical protein CDL12_21059 [Handroanthus impetiginosus]|uniref:Uncharacterized protein n=1 Tax=Handroanthus impetiginosus TaxID=429701 RepID=A0A2G9GM63_9LAMI|nr:hypothetical protein CDL12_21059 [Handroanthus impetiginosus]